MFGAASSPISTQRCCHCNVLVVALLLLLVLSIVRCRTAWAQRNTMMRHIRTEEGGFISLTETSPFTIYELLITANNHKRNAQYRTVCVLCAVWVHGHSIVWLLLMDAWNLHDGVADAAKRPLLRPLIRLCTFAYNYVIFRTSIPRRLAVCVVSIYFA